MISKLEQSSDIHNVDGEDLKLNLEFSFLRILSHRFT